MDRIFLDFETASRADLKKTGSSLYARHPSTRSLMLGWAINDDPVDVVEFARGEKAPKILKEALRDPEVIKSCWNKSFEYQIFKHVHGLEIPHDQWQDTMVLALHMSMPGSLDKAGPACGLPEEMFKNKKGTALINRFSKPRRITKTKQYQWDGWWSEPDLWEEFVEYNRQDVEAERAIFKYLQEHSLPVKTKWREHFKTNALPPAEHEYWLLDQEINEKGVPVNVKAAENAILIANTFQNKMVAEMQDITGLDNPNSTKQLLPWLQSQGYPFEDLKKSHVREMVSRLEKQGEDSDLFDMLKIRQQVSKSSVKKYDAITRSADREDGVIRYTLQFGGASRTNRHAGRILQPQNLPSPPKSLEDKQEELARDIEKLSPESFMLKYPDTMTALSAGIRPMIQAPEGHLFCDVDLGAIENRVLGWLARDEKILEVFRKKQDPYLSFATYMTGRPYADLWDEYKGGNKTVRTLAKPPTLGCFAADTLVLTARGYIPISEINDTDLLFDGCNWVVSDGYIYRGHKKTINIGGVNMTPDHKVLCGHEWVTADHLLADHRVLKRAYRTASTKLIINLRKERLHEPAARIDEEIATFDIVNCGPKNRFTILTKDGHLIVHNCGYRLGVGEQRVNKRTGEMEATGLLGYAQNMGVTLSPQEAKHAVTVFRETFTEVVQFWYDLERAVKRVLRKKEPVRVGYLVFDLVGDFLRMILPSGRPIYYKSPRMELVRTPWGEMRENFTYYGVDDKKKWGKITSQGGKFAEQCTQATARDILMNGLILADEKGLDIRFHVHDQIITLSKESNAERDLLTLKDCMETVPSWAPGLILGAEGSVVRVFQKD